MAYRPPDDDDPFEMRGKRPPKETEGGYQDTSIDDAKKILECDKWSNKEVKGGNREVGNLRKWFI